MSSRDPVSTSPRELRYRPLERRTKPSFEDFAGVNPACRTQLYIEPQENIDLEVEEVQRSLVYLNESTRGTSRSPLEKSGNYDDHHRHWGGHDGKVIQHEPHKYSKSSRHDSYKHEDDIVHEEPEMKQNKIIAATIGGILGAGAKEAWDRREAHRQGKTINRSLAASVMLAAGGALAGYQGAQIRDKDAAKEASRFNGHKSKSLARSNSCKDGAGSQSLTVASLGVPIADYRRSRSIGGHSSSDSDNSDGYPPQRHSRRNSVRSGISSHGVISKRQETSFHSSQRYDGVFSTDSNDEDDEYLPHDCLNDGRSYRYGDEKRQASTNRSRSMSRQPKVRLDSPSSSDLGDSDQDKKKTKKMRHKQLITAALATVATVHAVHNVHQSIEKRKARKEAVRKGFLDPSDVKSIKSKTFLRDAASVGIAAIGIKGAISEIKEVYEQNHLATEWEEEKARRHQRRTRRIRESNNDP
jgi:hypothetical protein